MEEIWKKIPIDSELWISNLGRVKKNGKLVKTHRNWRGSRTIHAKHDGKFVHFSIARLVWEAFNGHISMKKAHFEYSDGNRGNPSLQNLIFIGDEDARERLGKSSRKPKYIIEDEFGNKTYYSSMRKLSGDLHMHTDAAKALLNTGEWFYYGEMINLP